VNTKSAENAKNTENAENAENTESVENAESTENAENLKALRTLKVLRPQVSNRYCSSRQVRLQHVLPSLSSENPPCDFIQILPLFRSSGIYLRVCLGFPTDGTGQRSSDS